MSRTVLQRMGAEALFLSQVTGTRWDDGRSRKRSRSVADCVGSSSRESKIGGNLLSSMRLSQYSLHGDRGRKGDLVVHAGRPGDDASSDTSRTTTVAHEGVWQCDSVMAGTPLREKG